MKKLLFFSILFSVLLVVNRCSKAPIYPITPQIEFKSIVLNSADSTLHITVTFKDGDGDLGLTSDDVNPPFNRFDFIKDGNGNLIKYNSVTQTPVPYSCNDYEIQGADTLYIKLNPNYYNYFADMMVEQAGGTFQLFDIQKETCIPFSGRFPLLSTDKGPIRGDLEYVIDFSLIGANPSLYEDNFKQRNIKFKISIEDKALHKSNTIETSTIYFNL